MILQMWKIHCLNMFKMLEKVINSIMRAIEIESRTSSKRRNQRGNFQ